MIEKRIVYSVNGEDFCYDDWCEVRDYIAADAIEGCDYTYYEAEAVQRKASKYFSIAAMLENMQEWAWDDAGEYADDFPDLTDDERNELNTLICKWLDENIRVNFWTVQNVKKKTMTAEKLL